MAKESTTLVRLGAALQKLLAVLCEFARHLEETGKVIRHEANNTRRREEVREGRSCRYHWADQGALSSKVGSFASLVNDSIENVRNHLVLAIDTHGEFRGRGRSPYSRSPASDSSRYSLNGRSAGNSLSAFPPHRHAHAHAPGQGPGLRLTLAVKGPRLNRPTIVAPTRLPRLVIPPTLTLTPSCPYGLFKWRISHATSQPLIFMRYLPITVSWRTWICRRTAR